MTAVTISRRNPFRGIARADIDTVRGISRDDAAAVFHACGGGRTRKTMLSAPGDNAKGAKSALPAYLLYLSAHRSANLGNLCPWSNPNCRGNCLALYSGHMPFGNNRRAQHACTMMMVEHPEQFLALWRWNLLAAARKHNGACWHRPNGGSDVPWERYDAATEIIAEVESAGMLIRDYTKATPAQRPQPRHLGYRLARSVWPTKQTADDVATMWASGEHVAAVVDDLAPLADHPAFASADATDEWMLTTRPVIGALTAKRGTNPQTFSATELVAAIGRRS